MNQYDSHQAKSIEIASEELSPEALDRVINHFGRHATELADVGVYHDRDTGELRFVGDAADSVSREYAEQVLRLAIQNARTIHPADNLDMSA